MNDARAGSIAEKVVALLLMVLPSWGLYLALAGGAQTWEAPLLGIVAAGMLLAVASA